MRFDLDRSFNSESSNEPRLQRLTTILLGTSITFWRRLPFWRGRLSVAYVSQAVVLWCGGLFLVTLGDGRPAGFAVVGISAALGGDARTGEQREQGRARRWTKVGDVAPEFSVVADDGSSVESSSLREGGRIEFLRYLACPCIRNSRIWISCGTNSEITKSSQ